MLEPDSLPKLKKKKPAALTAYRKKRKFTQTPEPKSTPRSHERNLFVVQKHDASHLHYDFRLQIGGVLKSWAVPKGPPKTTSEKRLAVETEDHPLAYATFSGKIPEGNYGAGTVEIWDHGKFYSLKDISLKESYQEGHLEFWLEGNRLNGPYALIKTHFGKGNSWLFIKMKKKKYDK